MGAKYRDIVQEHSKAKRGARAILNVLANYAPDADGVAFPGYERISQDAGVSIRTVERNIRALVELGEIEIVNGQTGPGITRRIRITLGQNTRQTDHITRQTDVRTPDKLTISPDNLSQNTRQSDANHPTNSTSSLYIEPTTEPITEPRENRARATPTINPGEYLPGLPLPRWNREKRQTDAFMVQARGLGIDSKPFRLMVDAVLDATGKRGLVEVDDDPDGIAILNDAKRAVLTLAQMDARWRSVGGIENLVQSWRENDWRGATAPTVRQLKDHASAILAGTHITKDPPETPKLFRPKNAFVGPLPPVEFADDIAF